MQTTNLVVAQTGAIISEPEPLNLRKRIGSTTYVATIRFSQTSRETLADKVLRLARNNGLDFQADDYQHADATRTGRLRERSAEI
jgi:hypothetical protein